MKLLLMLSMRNLFRQKRRSLLLGTAIAFGMMILVVANSFARGLSDNLLNRMIVYMSGHMEVSIMEKSRQYLRVIRDRDRMVAAIRKNVSGIKEINESVALFTKVIGNGKSDNSVLVGVELNDEFRDYLKTETLSGDWKEFTMKKVENPVIVYADKAKLLNVKVGDIIKARLMTINGQQQSARFNVVALIRSNNIFESMAIFVDLGDLKSLLGYRPYETGALQVNFTKLNNPRFAIGQAEALHKTLQPGTAGIFGTASSKKATTTATMLGFYGRAESISLMEKNLKLEAGSIPDKDSDAAALVSRDLADRLKLRPGSEVLFTHRPKFEKKNVETTLRISGIYANGVFPRDDVILAQEDTFYKIYLENLPVEVRGNKDACVPEQSHPLFAALSPEWKLMPRSAKGEDLKKKLNDMNKTRWKGPHLDVRTMYESASQILDLEWALNLITYIAVLILFFIILIGVINTLRMTIRERTREIGTVRAIGMQKNDVRNSFIIETLLLSFFSCCAGIAAAFIVIGILGAFTIETQSVFSILLVEKHLYFLAEPGSIATFLLLILGISAMTAYFPASRAARLSAAEALRHFE